jgi:hypothetical protein
MNVAFLNLIRKPGNELMFLTNVTIVPEFFRGLF